jgi:hypothetical protein
MREATQAHFRFSMVKDVMVIEDMDIGGKSVTNDIENVLRDIREIHMDRTPDGDFPKLPRKIIYCDSNGIFDGIHATPEGAFISFYPIQTRYLDMALERAKGAL